MVPSRVDDALPELAPFVHAVQGRRPYDGTWCEAWTVRDVLAHQTGNAEELARVLQAFLDGSPVETRDFTRDTPFRRISDADLWAAFLDRCERLAEVAAAAALFLHRWDLTGDSRTAVQALNEPWMTEHGVVSVGRPLLSKGHAAGHDLGPDGRIEGRLRAPGTDDIGDRRRRRRQHPPGPARRPRHHRE
ncbi:hypothetical protein OG552_25170 [Streptomyces sp. NBC_01476]|uniref:maleylpyruvate isomerase N-terminal domain-containing protein n=1 Tax=Streptomyces sp. NBC_01476 TaxID=2903881 RepID=UPI002E376BA3|nr:maleylpyruvate isomerase N-terminal domain-containing protein [Streptomyces sp. NBC_01476]